MPELARALPVTRVAVVVAAVFWVKRGATVEFT
ncbi:hypothetical protein [Mycolicibacterium sp. XJ1904]